MKFPRLGVLLVALAACTGPAESPPQESAFRGEVVSVKTIPDRCCASRLTMRYENNSARAARIECKLMVTNEAGGKYPRWVTSLEEVTPGASGEFTTISEIGRVDSVEDMVLESCKEAP